MEIAADFTQNDKDNFIIILKKDLLMNNKRFLLITFI